MDQKSDTVINWRKEVHRSDRPWDHDAEYRTFSVVSGNKQFLSKIIVACFNGSKDDYFNGVVHTFADWMEDPEPEPSKMRDADSPTNDTKIVVAESESEMADSPCELDSNMESENNITVSTETASESDEANNKLCAVDEL